jgi:hypothetical protein
MRRIIRHFKLHLHPRRDADVIAFLAQIERGDIAQTIIDALRQMAQGSQPLPVKPALKSAAKPVGAFVPLDDSEGFN